MSKITFNNASSPFFKQLKAKVDNYFTSKRIEPSGNVSLYLKGLFQILTAVFLYTILVFFTPDTFLSIILCFLLGINLGLIGFNVMHEGGHSSFSRYKWINHISAYSLNVLGGSAMFWKVKHNVNHHTYTNIEGMDADIEVEPFMRLHDNQKRYWFHRFQHIYWIFLYSLTYFLWVFVNDFSKYFSGNIAPGSKRTMEVKEHLIFWFTKIMYIIAYIMIPVYMTGWLNAMIGFIIIVAICGLCISVVFQLAHVVEDTTFPKPDADSNQIKQEWAIHQISTTANFATKNRLLSWMVGGLNFQVEHHLFPKVSHIHYPKINQFVKETCKEFNVKYVEYPSMFRAICSHVMHIRRLGLASAVYNINSASVNRKSFR